MCKLVFAHCLAPCIIRYFNLLGTATCHFLDNIDENSLRSPFSRVFLLCGWVCLRHRSLYFLPFPLIIFFHSTLSKGIDNILDILEFWNPLLEKLCHIFSFYQKEYVKWTVTLMSTKSCRFSRIMSTKLSYIRDWLNIGKVAYLMLHLLQIVRILLNNTNNQSLSISFSLEIR